jgi:hypothetical protein
MLKHKTCKHGLKLNLLYWTIHDIVKSPDEYLFLTLYILNVCGGPTLYDYAHACEYCEY